MTTERAPLVITVDGAVLPRGAACSTCLQRVFPAATSCPNCHTPSMVEAELADSGVVYSHTRVHTGSDPSYVLAYVDLDDGVRLLGRVDHEVSIGSRVRVRGSDGDAITFGEEGVAHGG